MSCEITRSAACPHIRASSWFCALVALGRAHLDVVCSHPAPRLSRTSTPAGVAAPIHEVTRSRDSPSCRVRIRGGIDAVLPGRIWHDQDRFDLEGLSAAGMRRARDVQPCSCGCGALHILRCVARHKVAANATALPLRPERFLGSGCYCWIIARAGASSCRWSADRAPRVCGAVRCQSRMGPHDPLG
jgi:hypothetical protein